MLILVWYHTDMDMIKVETANLDGQALDWAVAEGLGITNPADPSHVRYVTNDFGVSGLVVGTQGIPYSPRLFWSQGGLIIERVGIIPAPCLANKGQSVAFMFVDYMPEYKQSGATYLIAGMRCYVCFKFGDSVEVPAYLIS